MEQNQKLHRVFGCLILLLYLPLFALDGKFINIHDGDTVTILTVQKERIKIRLYGIDAPELKQPFGKAAKRHLSKLTQGKNISIDLKGNDRYKRKLGILLAGNKDINAQMVADGYAWAYVKFSKIYKHLEQSARSQNLGIWRSKYQTPPWEFRR